MSAGPERLTERLVLRLALPTEAEAVADFQRRNRAHFAPWEPVRSEAFYTAAFWTRQLAEDVEAMRADRRYRMFVWPKHTPDRCVGFVHFSNVVRGAFQACHLGFGVDAEVEGQGLAKEAVGEGVAWAFGSLRLHRIEANHRPENVRSARRLRRLGFVPQGYARDYLRIDGAWRDHVLTALTNEAWPEP